MRRPRSGLASLRRAVGAPHGRAISCQRGQHHLTCHNGSIEQSAALNLHLQSNARHAQRVMCCSTACPRVACRVRSQYGRGRLCSMLHAILVPYVPRACTTICGNVRSGGRGGAGGSCRRRGCAHGAALAAAGQAGGGRGRSTGVSRGCIRPSRCTGTVHNSISRTSSDGAFHIICPSQVLDSMAVYMPPKAKPRCHRRAESHASERCSRLTSA